MISCERQLRLPEVLHIVGRSRSTVYAAIKRGEFPKPIRAGKRISVWLQSEIFAFVQQEIRQAKLDASIASEGQ